MTGNVNGMIFRQGVHDILVDGISLFEFRNIFPKERPYVVPPKIKTNMLEVSGAHSKINLSTILTGYPLYDRRTGSWEYGIMPERPINGVINTKSTSLDANHVWLDRYNTLMSQFSRNYGKSEIILCDSIFLDENGKGDLDKMFFYKGALSVDQFKNGKTYSSITINYDLEPFRYSYKTVAEINPDKFKTFEINSTELTEILTVNFTDMHMYGNYFKPQIGTLNPSTIVISEPTYPTISVWTTDTNGIEIGFVNNELKMNRSEIFSEGVHDACRFTITPGCKFYAKGNGAVKIDWRNRAL